MESMVDVQFIQKTACDELSRVESRRQMTDSIMQAHFFLPVICSLISVLRPLTSVI